MCGRLVLNRIVFSAVGAFFGGKGGRKESGPAGNSEFIRQIQEHQRRGTKISKFDEIKRLISTGNTYMIALRRRAAHAHTSLMRFIRTVQISPEGFKRERTVY